jgi:hypothetical protein
MPFRFNRLTPPNRTTVSMNNQLQNSPYFFQLKKKNLSHFPGFPSSEENHFCEQKYILLMQLA